MLWYSEKWVGGKGEERPSDRLDVVVVVVVGGWQEGGGKMV
jgi:hypothetical protein